MAKIKEEELYSLQEVQNELRAIGADLSLAEITDICKSPLIATTFAMNRGVDVRLPVWGTLLRKHRYVIGLKQKALLEMKGIIPDGEYHEMRKMLAKAHKRQLSKIPKVDIEELLALPKIHRSSHRYDKLVENQTYVPLAYYYDEDTRTFIKKEDE